MCIHLHTGMIIIKLLKLPPDHIFCYLWPAMVVKKSVEFFLKAESHAFKLSLLMYDKNFFLKASNNVLHNVY